MMQNEEQYMDRTPDLVAKIRKLREAAEKEMNRFTRVADYDVRRVVGQKPKASPVSDETVSPSSVSDRPKKSAAEPIANQVRIQFEPAPAEQGNHEEDE